MTLLRMEMMEVHLMQRLILNYFPFFMCDFGKKAITLNAYTGAYSKQTLCSSMHNDDACLINLLNCHGFFSKPWKFINHWKFPVAIMVYLLQAKMKIYLEWRWQNGITFEEVWISQENKKCFKTLVYFPCNKIGQLVLLALLSLPTLLNF